MRCSCCGRDINAIGQDNASYNEYPLCEDCGRGNNTNTNEQIQINKGVNEMQDTYIFKIDDEIKVTTRPNFMIRNDYDGRPYFVIDAGSPGSLISDLKEFNHNEFWEEYKRVLKNVHYSQEFEMGNLAVVIEVKDCKLSVYSV